MRKLTKLTVTIYFLFNNVFSSGYDSSWVYIGKMLYINESSPINTFNGRLEFDVYKKNYKDDKGYDVQIFNMEDSLNGLRRDSLFYHNGYWQVFENNSKSNESSLKTSSGSKSWRKYDDKGRLIENYLTDEKGDTLISEQYEWKNGRLIRMVEDGIVRNYIYGKTLQDTVRVIPPDYGVRGHSGYDKSVGKIPSEDDPIYTFFAMDPYRYTFYGKKDKENLKKCWENLSETSYKNLFECLHENEDWVVAESSTRKYIYIFKRSKT